MRRTGDNLSIRGDYQHDALTEGNSVQRFWHYSKQLAISQYLPVRRVDFVLDVGCGSGVIAAFLERCGANVLDNHGNPDAIRYATENFATSNVKFRLGLVDETFQVDVPVDKNYCLEVIEHIYLDQARNMLKTFYKLLRPGGKVFLTTPNYQSLWPVIEWLMDKLRLDPPLRDHQHVEFYNRQKLVRIGIDTGFEIETIITNCFLSPWIAPLSWSLAEKLAVSETRLPGFLGSILISVFVKPL